MKVGAAGTGRARGTRLSTRVPAFQKVRGLRIGPAERAVAMFAALCAVGAIYLRMGPVLAADFPLNDGGLFYLMTEELRRAGYSLPAFTAYNAAGLPFAYPPLGFYLAGFTADLTGASVLDVVRVLPAVFSVLTIPAFYLLANDLLRSRAEAAVATAAFMFLPRTYLWFVMGGGLTRAPGFLFALLMLHQSYQLYTRREARFVVSTTVLGSLAVLSHLENAWFAVYSAVLLFLVYGRNRKSFVHSLLVMAGVLVLTAPWWATVLRQHGTWPFAAVAAGGGYDNFNLGTLKVFWFTQEPYMTLLSALGLLGVFVCLFEGKLLVPFWMLAMFFVNPRNPETVANVPLAMLVGISVVRLVVPGLCRAALDRHSGGDTHPAPEEGREIRERLFPSRGTALLAAGVCAYLAGYAFTGARRVARDTPVLPRSDRDAMRWAAAHTHPRSAFLVFAGNPSWFGLDPVSEWFPVLAGRASVATVQGYEWLPGRPFFTRQNRYKSLRECEGSDVSCLDRWGADGGARFNYVYLHTPDCCSLLSESLHRSPRYAKVYDAAGVAIFARKAPL